MLEALQSFIGELRLRGVEVSPAEAVDAARAAAAVGPERRTLFRTALAATLIKDFRARAVFDDVFESFFAPPARTGAGHGRGERGGGGGAGGRGLGGEPASSAPAGPGKPPPPTAGAGRGRPAVPDRPDERRKPSGRPGGDSDAPARGPGAPRAAATRLRTLRPEEVRREIAGKQHGGAPPAPTGRIAGTRTERIMRPAGTDDRGRPSRGRARLPKVLVSEAVTGDSRHLRRRRFAGVTTDEERALAAETARIVDEIRARRSRRLRPATRGRLWMKRAIRENLATGGVPFRIPQQQPRRRRSRIILLVDVSWSVSRAAGLFLLMALEFLRPARRASIHVFVDEPFDVTDRLRRWLRVGPEGAPARAGSAGWSGARASAVAAPPAPSPGWSPYPSPAPSRRGRGQGAGGRRAPARDVARGILPACGGVSFAEILGSVPGLNTDAPSDYGRAFYAFAAGPLRAIGRDAVLLVLGDGRSNDLDPLPWAFEEIAARARRVIWLVPEPRALWGTGDSALGRYLPFCDVAVETADLDGLAHGVRELLAAV